jgi:glutamine amidotransferase-like uncharacterized protein
MLQAFCRWSCRTVWGGALLLLVTGSLPAEAPIWVAVYNHSGAEAKAPKTLASFLNEQAGFRCEVLTPAEIRDGRLDSFDVLIMPGGSGSKQAANLEEAGREKIREFVKSGKGYMGICAGSYLASSQYDWSLNLINARVFDREHWARGTGQVQLTISDAGQELLQTGGPQVEVYYGQGPLLVPDDEADLPAFEVLASYASEIAKKGAPSGVMVGTTAIARAPYGEGRVICFSPHCEVTDGPRQMVTSAIEWAAGRKAVPLPVEASETEPKVEQPVAAQQD